MTNKSRGSYSATYGYKYGQMLCSVTSNWPGEGNVSYNYGGSLQRRERTAGSTTTKYRWSSGFELISQEDSAGNLQYTYWGELAVLIGANPSLGNVYYITIDLHSRNTNVQNDEGESIASSACGPFGETLDSSGNSSVLGAFLPTTDSVTGLQSTPFRNYSSVLSRWITREPFGFIDGTNMYAYVACNPVYFMDRNGLFVDTIWDLANVLYDVACGHWGDAVVDGAAAFFPFIPAGATKLRHVKRIANALRRAEKNGGYIPTNIPPSIIDPARARRNSGVGVKGFYRLDNGHTANHAGTAGASAHLHYMTPFGEKSLGGRGLKGLCKMQGI